MKKEAEQKQAAAALIENRKTKSLPEKPQSLIPSRTKKFSKQRKTLMPNRLIPYKYENNTDADFSLSEISNAISRKCNISDYPDNVKDFGSNEENQKILKANENKPKDPKYPITAMRNRASVLFNRIENRYQDRSKIPS